MELIPVTQIQTPNLDDWMILLRSCSLTKNWKKFLQKLLKNFYSVKIL